MECAKAVVKNKNSYLSAQYKRICSRRGKNRAAVAVGHSILVIAYYLLKNGKEYKDLGADFFDKKKKESIVKNTVKKLESLGYKVTLEEELTA